MWHTRRRGNGLAHGQWVSEERGAVALIAPLLLFDPPGVALRGETRGFGAFSLDAVLCVAGDADDFTLMR